MRPKRLFWIGLGTGMMAGALLLQLLNAGQSRASTWAGAVDQAGGSPLSASSGEAYTQEEVDALIKAAVDKAVRDQNSAVKATGTKGAAGTGQADRCRIAQAVWHAEYGDETDTSSCHPASG